MNLNKIPLFCLKTFSRATFFVSACLLLLGASSPVNFANASESPCEELFNTFPTVSHSLEFFESLPAGWLLSPLDTSPSSPFAKSLSQAMSRELLDIGYWNDRRTSDARLPIPVARLTNAEIDSMRAPRFHKAMSAWNSENQPEIPEHIQRSTQGAALPSENFNVRMMVIKDRNSNQLLLPKQLAYLRPFIDKVVLLEQQRDPDNYFNRYIYIQVDASWVKAHENQFRPGRTTTQSPQINARQGAHVDGFLKEEFWSLQEDVTYSASFGFSQNGSESGDSIPTEFFNLNFPVPPGATHREARLIYDQIANASPGSRVFMPPGFIQRMSSRVVHRVGVATTDTYRTFVKLKFSDEAFHQIGNTVNTDDNGKPSSIYSNWESRGIPLVNRATLPTEGNIEERDVEILKKAGRTTLDGRL